MTEAADFATRVRATGPLAANQVAHVISSVAAEVDGRVGAGVPHGRLSPAAIALTPDGRVVLVDPASLGGAPDTGAHAAPEIFAGAAPDARSEVFSLASTAYTLLTGTTPNSFGIANARQARPDLGPGLEAVLTRATSRDPAFRFQSAADFARALAEALVPTPTAPGPPPGTPAGPVSGAARTGGPLAGPWLGVAALVLGMLALGLPFAPTSALDLPHVTHYLIRFRPLVALLLGGAAIAVGGAGCVGPRSGKWAGALGAALGLAAILLWTGAWVVRALF